MTRQLLTTALMASLTVGAAIANPLGFGGNNKPTTTPVVQALTPELDAAGQKCDNLHAKLEQARKQLEAAKANLKAAESELRAARADKEALGLRTEATQLASKAAVDPIVGSGQTTNGLGVVGVDSPVVHQIDSLGAAGNASPLPGVNSNNGTPAMQPPTLQDLAPANVP